MSVNEFDEIMDNAGVMDIESFKNNVVWNLSNKGWVRYWLRYVKLSSGQFTMAIQLRDNAMKSVRIDGIDYYGFVPYMFDNDIIYLINRVHENGKPYLDEEK